jgi:hypothetical protein
MDLLGSVRELGIEDLQFQASPIKRAILVSTYGMFRKVAQSNHQRRARTFAGVPVNCECFSSFISASDERLERLVR